MKNYYLNMALFLYIIKKAAKKLLQKIKKLPRLISQNYFKFRIFITYEKVLISEFSNLIKSYVSYVGPKIWSQVPQEVKFLESFRSFKRAIKKWVPGTCQSLQKFLKWCWIYIVLPLILYVFVNHVLFLMFLLFLSSIFCLIYVSLRLTLLSIPLNEYVFLYVLLL